MIGMLQGSSLGPLLFVLYFNIACSIFQCKSLISVKKEGFTYIINFEASTSAWINEPVIIKLFGIYAALEDSLDKSLLDRIKAEPLTDPYQQYTKDVQICLTTNPTVSLTENYMNFGGVPIVSQTSSNTKTLITSLTNHTEDTLSVAWERDEVFKITPERVDLPAGESVLLECTFSPDNPDSIYEKHINGCILWTYKETSATSEAMTIPLNASLRCLGHSFAQNTYWFPQLEIVPETIVLPAAAPDSTAFVTFMLKATGRLPVSFVFIPPNQTNFIVKPMIGMVKDYRLIVAQLQCPTMMEKSKLFVEQWKIMLNDQSDHLIYFYIKGFVDLPAVEIGKNNRVNFPNVQSLCTETIQVRVQNNSQHHIRYEFLTNEHKNLTIEEQTGELRVNEMKLLNWNYKNDDNKSSNFKINCILHIIEKKLQIVGKPYNHSVHVSVICCNSELCCNRDHYDAGIVECMQTVTVCMEAFNFGKSSVYYKLFANFEMEPEKEDLLVIENEVGALPPMEATKIELKYRPYSLREHKFTILYRLRQGPKSNLLVAKYEKRLFTFACQSVYSYVENLYWVIQTTCPVTFSLQCDELEFQEKNNNYKSVPKEFYRGSFVFRKSPQEGVTSVNFRFLNGNIGHVWYRWISKIINITEHNFGHLFTNPNLWTLLNLVGLNHMLRMMKYSDSTTFTVNLPDNECCKKDFYITLALKNPTPFPITIRMSRLKLCDCPLVEVSKALSLRKQEYRCPHRNVFAISPKEVTIEAKSINYINFHIRYSLIGTTMLCYRLVFPQNRELTIEFVIRTLSSDDKVISKYTDDFYISLPPIWYGEKDPNFHIFWFYNVSSVAVGYVLDIVKLNQLNEQYDFEVLKCLNPVGMVGSFLAVPLMFKFSPIDDKMICVTLPLRIGNNFTYFQVSCSGSKHFHRFQAVQNDRQPLITGSTLVISEDNITLNPIPLFSVTNRIFFLRNTSSKTAVAYTCKRYKLPGVVEATVVFPKGIIGPNGSQAIIVQVRSYGQACRIQVQITVKYLEVCKFAEHKKYLKMYQQRQEEIEGQFVITEKGIEYPKNEVQIPPFPEFSYVSVTLDVSITSLSDRDLHYSTEDQLKQSPHTMLRLDDQVITRETKRESRGSEETEPVIVVDMMDCPMKRFSRIAMNDIDTNEWTDYDLYHDLLEYLLSDVVFSKLFGHILYKIHDEPALYYSQIRIADQDEKNTLLSDLYLVPQPPLVTEILKQTIADSIFQIYKLGAMRRSSSSEYDEEKMNRYRSILKIL